MTFKNFEIRQPTILGKPPTDDYFKYNFDVVKWADGYTHCWSIGHLTYNRKNCAFDFRSVGLRYLEDREDGLEEFIFKWCELQSIIIRSSEEGG